MTHPYRRTTLFRLIFRFFAGRPLNGVPRTDADYLHRGTRALTTNGRASRWSYRPGYQRQLWRLGWLALIVGTCSGAIGSTELMVIAAVGTVYATVRVWRAIVRWNHDRRYVRPTAAVLAQLLGHDPHTPTRWLYIPRALVAGSRTWADRVSLPGWLRTPDRAHRLISRARRAAGRLRPADPDQLDPVDVDQLDPAAATEPVGVIRYPVGLLVTAELQKTVASVVTAKLGNSDLRLTWHQVGADPHVSIRGVPRPPAMVRYADVASMVRAARDSAPVMGLGPRGKVVSVDLDTEYPHLAVSCGTGAGKSVLLRGIIAQLLHNGAQVLVLDVKRVSQSWCKDLPGVTYCRTGREIHDALLAMDAELDRRYTVLDSVPAEEEDSVNVGPRIAIVWEEQNFGMDLLREYWQSIKKRGEPNVSPAIRAYTHILAAGRQIQMHLISVAQMFTVQSAGGNPVARENYGARVLGRATRNAWLMLAPEAYPFPRQSKRRGRMHLVMQGSDPVEVQTVLWTPQEAREYATSGAPVTVPAGWVYAPEQRDSGPAVTEVTSALTLPEIARRNIVPMTYGALRQAKSRDPEFPDPTGKEGNSDLYRAVDIIAWHQTRKTKKESAA